MKNLYKFNKNGKKLQMKYMKLFNNQMVDGIVYLEEFKNKVTF